MEGECKVKECKAGVIKSETLTECSNVELIPNGIKGPVVGKIPVVIAEPVVQVDVESVIELEEPAFEIKRIKKNLFITQCKVIDTGYCKSGKLFLSGYVRKNIEYATADCSCGKSKSISGEIKHTTVNVPFSCVTNVNFTTNPQVCYQESTKEKALYVDSICGNEYCGQKIIGQNPCEQSFQHHECFNEKIYCELEEVKIFEDDIYKNPEHLGHGFHNEYIFDKIIEKMVILVRLKLLQNQQVNVPGNKHDCEDKK